MGKVWRVEESPEVVLQLMKAPEVVRKKYAIWKRLLAECGPFLPGKGWNTEALKGSLKGFYSARLNRAWRVVFEYEGKVRIVAVLSVTPHLYRRIQR